MFLFKKLNHDLLNYYKNFKMGEIVERGYTKKYNFWYTFQVWIILVHTTRLGQYWYIQYYKTGLFGTHYKAESFMVHTARLDQFGTL